MSGKWTFHSLVCGKLFLLVIIMSKNFILGELCYQSNLMSFLSPKFILSILHYRLYFWRYEAPKMGGDFLNNLYVYTVLWNNVEARVLKASIIHARESISSCKLSEETIQTPFICRTVSVNGSRSLRRGYRFSWWKLKQFSVCNNYRSNAYWSF